jgi:HSP20 family protein
MYRHREQESLREHCSERVKGDFMPASIKKSRSTTGSLADSRRDIYQAVGWQVQVRSGAWSPPTDVYETTENYIIRVEIAGMREDDFEIVIDNNLLSISGSRPDELERRAYQQMEIRFGKFETTIGLPGPVNIDGAGADYRGGFLTVTIPKMQVSKIEVQEE